MTVQQSQVRMGGGRDEGWMQTVHPPVKQKRLVRKKREQSAEKRKRFECSLLPVHCKTYKGGEEEGDEEEFKSEIDEDDN
ncbi:uncharacterized protein MONOS_7309 [Monocercomonoides exilis]|uniref:uncharacterized protein n=1 Tax=Monocercomonoides exilis TaxID=2049356 RepID=UPI003559CC12|nr:hypothetical protein MONOS_7309 [Monocercomonoides exilis]|eukprot:MONOS_7309.1-p1 / transcript=MONOS_7309.1 / gene=MONOS_7309 / organism=Monocercomonoides_exilis_PA203 / gene_product=unspecified product / transcript_product=unspecified product / location=Mono_scaffold00247:37162-37620(-) / protein_length=80 / sequence_SO=supercontig / SO=protein_coding / is_pseudo=false